MYLWQIEATAADAATAGDSTATSPRDNEDDTLCVVRHRLIDDSYGLCSYGLHIHGLCSYGLYSYCLIQLWPT